jgi:hypothetical protein
MTATTTQDHRKTVEVCADLQTTYPNVRYYTLVNLIRYGLIPRPGKDASGDLCWSPADVAAARRVLDSRAARRPRRETIPA